MIKNLLLSGLLAGLFLVSARGDDWPQWLGPNRDGVWRETGILKTFPKEGPTVRWRTPIGSGYAGPSVVDGRVYVTDWIVGPNPAGQKGKGRSGKERVLCLEEATGKILWKHEYDCRYQVGYPAGPRTTPLVAGEKVYTLGTMGDFYCLEAVTGKVIWSKNFQKDYNAPIQNWGFSANPLLDGEKLICVVGGEGSVAVAFHKDTGKELWRSLTAREQGYCPPMIYEAAGRRQLIIWHPESVNGLDPETGKVYWSVPFNIKAALTIPTPRKEGDLLFVSSFYNGSMMLKLDQDKPGVSVLWKGKSNSEQPRLTDGLHCLICTPFFKDGYIYGVCSYGELRCLKAQTGERLWETLRATGSQEKPVERWATAFLVPQGDRYFLFNEKGDLIIARLTPKGYEEISRANILKPDNHMANRPVVWSHPAFAHRSMYARNDSEIVCVSLEEKKD